MVLMIGMGRVPDSLMLNKVHVFLGVYHAYLYTYKNIYIYICEYKYSITALYIQILHAYNKCLRFTDTRTPVTSLHHGHGRARPDINRLGLIKDVLVVESICTPGRNINT